MDGEPDGLVSIRRSDGGGGELSYEDKERLRIY